LRRRDCGAKLALEASKKITALYLVGNQADIHAALPARGFARANRVKVDPHTEVLEMDDEPVAGDAQEEGFFHRSRRRVVGRRRRSRCAGVPGNTGGIFAAATFGVGRIEGVKRGCIATVIFPGRATNSCCSTRARRTWSGKPFHLAQFAADWAASIAAKS